MSLPLYPSQEKVYNEVVNNFGQCMIRAKPGTGKTAIAIKLLNYWYTNFGASMVFICVPSYLMYNWKVELERFSEVPYDLVELGKEKKIKRMYKFKQLYHRNNLEPEKLTIVLFNYEKVNLHINELLKIKTSTLIFDESHILRNKNKTTTNILRMSQANQFRLLLTGTPICNGYMDLYYQLRVIDKTLVGGLTEFKTQYVEMGGYMGKQIVGYKNLDKLKKILEGNSIYLSLEDCVDLPPITLTTLPCELSPKARTMYDEVSKEMITYLDRAKEDIPRKELKSICRSNGIHYQKKESYLSLLLKTQDLLNVSSCTLAITKIIRLQQITGGFLTLDSGHVDYIGTNKLKTTKEIIENSDNPVIISCQYVAEIEMLKKELSKIKGKRVYAYRDNKDKNYKLFNQGKVDVLILHNSTSMGLNLQKANQLILYSLSFSADNYVQLIARIRRSGQKLPMVVYHLITVDTIDKDIYNTVQVKLKLAKRFEE